MPSPNTTPKRCKCLIQHALTPEERNTAKERLNYSREAGCRQGIEFAMIALTGNCPAKEKGN